MPKMHILKTRDCPRTPKPVSRALGRRGGCLVAALSLGAVIAQPASACFAVQVENQTDRPLELIWRAEGCGGIFDDHEEVCHHKAVSGNGSESYDYPWIKTGPVVIIRDSHKSDKGESYTEWSYTHHDGGFRDSTFKGTPPHCDEHYTIQFSQVDWLSR